MVSTLIRKLAAMFTVPKAYIESFSFDLRLVVHQAPVAMCPASVAVVFRRISASSVKVIFQSEALVNPTEWGFQKILFCSGFSERSPSMFIVFAVGGPSWTVALLEAGTSANKIVGRLAASNKNGR